MRMTGLVGTGRAARLGDQSDRTATQDAQQFSTIHDGPPRLARHGNDVSPTPRRPSGPWTVAAQGRGERLSRTGAEATRPTSGVRKPHASSPSKGEVGPSPRKGERVPACGSESSDKLRAPHNGDERFRSRIPRMVESTVSFPGTSRILAS